jgi:hypothetical protein
MTIRVPTKSERILSMWIESIEKNGGRDGGSERDEIIMTSEGRGAHLIPTLGGRTA